jgi:hypothetical protein
MLKTGETYKESADSKALRIGVEVDGFPPASILVLACFSGAI